MKTINLPTLFNQRNTFVDNFDRVFDEIVKQSFPEFSREFGVDFISKGSYPKCDVIEYPEKVEIIAEIAGLTKDDVSIDLSENTLSISGEKQESKLSESAIVLSKELKHSSFKRVFVLSDKVNAEKIDAKFENGILTITLPKRKEDVKVSKRISIK